MSWPVRAIGLDLGERRIGVAVSDASGLLASPREIIERTAEPASYWARVRDLVDETGATLIVVGLPVSLDGRPDRDTATKAVAEAEALAEAVGVRVELQDERLTTALARRLSRPDPPTGAGRKARRPRRQRPGRRYDAEAAALILQSWLDAHRDRE